MVHSDGENEGVPRLIYPLWAVKQSNVTGSERTGLITHVSGFSVDKLLSFKFKKKHQTLSGLLLLECSIGSLGGIRVTTQLNIPFIFARP